MKPGHDVRKARIAVVTIFIMVVLLPFYGCSKEKSPSEAKKSKSHAAEKSAAQQQSEKGATETSQITEPEEGYIYQPRDRRDPFTPLIAPVKKEGKKDEVRAGTLQSYDISEFVLLAVATKSGKHFALLMTPDNRSFTVNEGTIIGFNKGRVDEITGNKVVLLEYVKDFKGDLRPKQVTLELLKER